MNTVIIALGGNALGDTPKQQKKNIDKAAQAIAAAITDNNRFVISHGNGPQVGMINLAFEYGAQKGIVPDMPFPECGAMSQGYIGYHLQSALQNELKRRQIHRTAAALVTQTIVAAGDTAFNNPTKPIGSFYTVERAMQLTAEKGYMMTEDAGRGWRRVVPSPKPIGIVEIDIIKTMLKAGHIPIAAGGGGIPVTSGDNRYRGVAAVIDKDLTSAVLADLLDADCLLMLTAVDKVAIHYRQKNQINLDLLTTFDAEKYITAGEFAPGSMLPKIEAALNFVNKKSGRRAIIASLKNIAAALDGKAGTTIIKQEVHT